jgi:alkanesulfonate monooxygenase SsuD/methylene tetrahydromethanopterin reductase-like flavin-dependent oxidoreductase (luciferase family)
VLFGVGAGWNAEELAHHGVAFADRWKVLDDRVRLMRELWNNDVASYDGEHARLEPSWQWPKPAQEQLRVWVGGGGKRAMQQAIDWDGGWMPMPSKEKFADRMAELQRMADAAGKPRPPVTLYLVRPNREVVQHYAELGVERVVFLLPTRGDAIGALRQIAADVGPTVPA